MRSVSRNPVRLAVAALTIVGLVAGCAFDLPPRVTLDVVHHVVDPAPPGGRECCTDVLALGDLDGDGRVDVVVGSERGQGPGLVWYRNPHWERHAVAAGDFTTDVKIADIDGDGDADIVVGTTRQGLLWFENRLREGQPWLSHKIADGYAHDIEVGDVNGDGLLDVLVCDKHRVTLFFQTAADRWVSRQVIQRPGEGIALADMDRDGDLDILFGGSWLETPADVLGGSFREHTIAPDAPRDTRVRVADLNGDGSPDVVLTASEGPGPVAWYEAPRGTGPGHWIRHDIDAVWLTGAHSLQVGDMNNDGVLDVVVAEMHTSKHRRVIVYVQDEGRWHRNTISNRGSHNLVIGDLDGDGDLDIVGKNYAGRGRVIEYWENRTFFRERSDRLDHWRYHTIDRSRPAGERGKMGLVFGDVDGDGWIDVHAGSFTYLNPRGRLFEAWRRIALPAGMDAIAALDLRHGRGVELLAVSGDRLHWLRKVAADALQWEAHRVAPLPVGRTQGYAVADVFPGGRPELVLTRGKHLLIVEVPERPNVADWLVTLVSTEVEEEGVAIGDIDGDGDLDIVATDHVGATHVLVWFQNPGRRGTGWPRRIVGRGENWLDRVALADIDGDGRLDIVATEETQDLDYNARVYWFEAPKSPTQDAWRRRTVATLRSVNSLSVADMDGDGDPDIVVAEHTDFTGKPAAADTATLVLENHGQGKAWVVHVVDRAQHSSHLGAGIVDLDRDGDLDIVSIAWEQYRRVHLWENRALHRDVSGTAGHARTR